MATIPPLPRWPLALGIGLSLLICLSCISLPQINTPARRVALPDLQMKTLEWGLAEDVEAERMTAYDLVPLFLPSTWGGWPTSPVAAFNMNEVPPFQTPAATFIYAPAQPGLQLSEIKAVPSLSNVLRDFKSSHAVWVLGRQERLLAELPQRLGYLEVFDLKQNKTVHTETLALPVTLPPRVADNLWPPLELSGLIDNAGLLGQLSVNQSAGIDEVDEFFRKWLREEVIPGLRVHAGFYLFRVGP